MLSKAMKIGFRWVLLVALAIVFNAACNAIAASSASAEVFELVEVRGLGPELDGKKVGLTLWGRGGEKKKGTRGSDYLDLVMGDETGNIKVFSTFPVYGFFGNQHDVVGTYHEEGRFAGYLAEKYIVITLIRRVWHEDGKSQTD